MDLHRNEHMITFFSTLLLLPIFVFGVTLKVNNNNGISTTENQLEALNKDQDKSESNYAFSYGVSDHNTGDQKSHWEKRENGVVSGAYSVLQPDGSTRLVKYTADSTGFHPVVQTVNQPAQSISSLYQYQQSTPYPYYQQSSYYTTPRPIRQFYNNPNTGYNYNGRYYFPGDYNAGSYLNSYGGYDSSYSGRGPVSGPYNLGGNRQRGSGGVPLLHSQYHGYDNLYH
ncbi:uncharacterized protein [Onthophagus taurus]|uniref:uncharacterized protein n=1 Tax=Onthophagus taurus TaxID=166361 RepID=UPI0039BE704D